MDRWQEEQIASLLNTEGEAGFFQALTQTAKELGFDYCTYGIRIPLPVSQPRVKILSNYPLSWQERYARSNYVATDPTVLHGRRSVLPLIWSDQLFAGARAFWDDARSHGLAAGWTQSCHDSHGVGSLLTLARSQTSLESDELQSISMKLSWLTQITHTGLSRLLVPKLMRELDSRLTARELEVLRWTADGKTSSEVGDIMNIAERTVNFHVRNALHKLDAVNKTAGVVKAAVLGLL